MECFKEVITTIERGKQINSSVFPEIVEHSILIMTILVSRLLTCHHLSLPLTLVSSHNWFFFYHSFPISWTSSTQDLYVQFLCGLFFAVLKCYSFTFVCQLM